MSQKPFTKREVAGIYVYQWIAWLISVAVIVAMSYLGITLPPLPPVPLEELDIGSRAGTTTSFGDLSLTGALTAGTGVTATTGGLTATAGGLTVSAGTTNIDGVLDLVVGTEHLGVPSVISTAITYTPTTGTIATIGDGEIWLIHDVLVHVTTNFDTGANNDATLTIGDGNDADGFITLADAELQTSDTEATGFAAGWQGLIPATQGVYIDEAAGANTFIYAPSGAAETIDYATGGTAADAGAATVYVIYTRIQ